MVLLNFSTSAEAARQGAPAHSGVSGSIDARSGASNKKPDVMHNYQAGLTLLIKEKLKPFFSYLGDLNLPQATHVLRKSEKAKYWSELTLPLQLLVDCERIYYDMSYLQHKTPREDAIKYMYLQVPTGLKSIVEGFGKLVRSPVEPNIKSASAALLQVCALVQCRMNMIALYQQLANHGAPDYDLLHNSTEKILHKYSPQLTHPWLTKLKHNMTNEVKVLKSLWKTQAHLARYQYKDTMLWLTICREKLSEWQRRFHRAIRSTTGSISQQSKRKEDRRPPSVHAMGGGLPTGPDLQGFALLPLSLIHI